MVYDTLYYDGQCSLCAKEIAVLKKQQTGQLRFIDIHQGQATPLAFSKEEMLKRLHLQTPNKEWLIGLDATVRSWSHTPYGWLLAPLRWPIIKPVADYCYERWADRRFEKRYACQSCSMDTRQTPCSDNGDNAG